jgi:hypothetical protein
MKKERPRFWWRRFSLRGNPEVFKVNLNFLPVVYIMIFC